MQTSWVAGFFEGLYRLYRLEVQRGSVTARGEITGFLAARYAAVPEVPRRVVKIVLVMRPILRAGSCCLSGEDLVEDA